MPFKIVADSEVAGDTYERLTGIFGLRMRVVRLQLGNEFIELIEYLAPRGRPIPVDSRSNDHWFQHIAIIVRDMDEAYAQLRKHNVEHVSPNPQQLPDWNSNASGIQAFYFRDPDGNNLEILQFPESKGDPKWHRKTNQLFLGIDHTAIVVNNTETSLSFYRDSLGLRIAETSENYGIEQERLNNVFGARLRITALKALHVPGIELLEYLAPRNGHPMPIDTSSNDLWHWQIQVTTANIDDVTTVIHGHHYDMLSNGTTKVPEVGFGLVPRFIALDPDGHALMFIQQQ